MRSVLFSLFFLILTHFTFAQIISNPLVTQDAIAQQKWVDSIYASMSLHERVGQLFMVQVMSNQDTKTKNKIIELIRDHKIGGIIYSLGGPGRQAKLNNELQSLSKVPMLIGMDAEWGLSMRLDSTYAFPWNMTMGAIKDNKLVEQAGRQIGEHNRRIGVHFNFAPVVDINTNPKNPIIGNRSFGEDKDNVTEKALAFMKGMQSAGVLANAKHFPGHGDTDQDSHKTLPTVSFDAERIDAIELYPYRKLIADGLSSVMVAHLNVPSLEPRKGYPSSLSHHIVTDILKNKLGFNGLIFTDALDMKGASNFSSSAEVDLAAFKAGNDVLLMSENVPLGIAKLVEAYNRGDITEFRLEHSVKKILQAKYKVGLNNYQPIGLNNLHDDLNRIKDDILYEELLENAITIVKDEDEILPFRDLENKSIAYVKMGDDDGSDFFTELKKYTKVHEIKSSAIDSLLMQLSGYEHVIVGFHKSNSTPWKSHKFSADELKWLKEIAKSHKVILNVFTKPYALLDLDNNAIKNIKSIVVSYQNSIIAQQKSAQLLFGAIPANGALPVSIGNHFKVGEGIVTNSILRLGYTIPERVGMSSFKLKKVDSLAQLAVDMRMTPGIQLLIARKGKVIYNKNFGKHTYEGEVKVKFDDVFDVASLTKILATLPLVMELEERGEITLDTKLPEILPEYKNSNKSNITIKSMLSHYARLRPWEPFYYKTLDVNNKPSPKYYRDTLSTDFNIEVAKNLFLRSDYRDTINEIIKNSKLLDKQEYRYSDFPYFILKKYIEHYYDRDLDQLTQEHFYQSLGANYMMYNPYNKISNINIVPTEEDNYYRYQRIHGYVHDSGAAMQNGIGGHAGIFSNANDVAKMMQMFLQKGFYGGKRYLKPETIDKFNTAYYKDKKNRRGIGFDKPLPNGEGPTCGCVSMNSFGHSGFTGTYTWADPDAEIVYVFLANRTYPEEGDNLLLKKNIRTDIQSLIYKAIEN